MPNQRDPSPYQYPYPPPSISSQRPLQSNYSPASSLSPYQQPHQLLHPHSSSPSSPEFINGAVANSYSSASTAYEPKSAEEGRILMRTPSPTPSEQKELKSGAFDWKTLSNWRFWIRREWFWYYVALVVILVITALITIYHEQIVHWLTPVTKWLHDLPFGWLVPIGVLFVISFPPLFGHEIVAILCGLVWGLWIGFGIVSAGTLLGEIGNFYAFKYCCRARGEKMEKTNITYACLAQVVRDGGFKIALVIRLSAIPGHFTTAVFSTCGMGIIVFTLAALFSMPKQLITVYLGVILEQSASGETDKKSKIISNVVLALTLLITLVSLWYIYHMMNKVKPQVIYARRKARQGKLARAASHRMSNISDDDGIPLTLKVQAPSVNRASFESSSHHSHDDQAYLYAPQPRKAGGLPKPQETENVQYVYSGGHGHNDTSHHARASTDEVGWDLNSRTPMHLEPGTQGVYGYHPRGHTLQEGSSEALTLDGNESRETLIQGQQSGSGGRRDEREFGYGMGHAVEPTDASYRTAREASDVEDSVNPFDPPPPRLVDPRRTDGGGGPSSPPPPSYRTNAR